MKDNDPWDPYILGQPFGPVGTTIAIVILIAIFTAAGFMVRGAIIDHNTRIQGNCARK